MKDSLFFVTYDGGVNRKRGIYPENRPKRQKGSVMSVVKDQIWLSDKDVEGVAAAEGVERRIKSYTDELMVVENVFQKGAVGSLHSHPHTQITYVVSGKFEFNIGGEKRIVTAGDTMLKKNGIEHGCVCLEAGILLDIFSPMREDFVK